MPTLPRGRMISLVAVFILFGFGCSRTTLAPPAAISTPPQADEARITTTTEKWIAYINEELGFRFEYPEGWGKFYYTRVPNEFWIGVVGTNTIVIHGLNKDFIFAGPGATDQIFATAWLQKNNEQYLIGFSGLGREPVYAHVKPKKVLRTKTGDEALFVTEESFSDWGQHPLFLQPAGNRIWAVVNLKHDTFPGVVVENTDRQQIPDSVFEAFIQSFEIGA